MRKNKTNFLAPEDPKEFVDLRNVIIGELGLSWEQWCHLWDKIAFTLPKLGYVLLPREETIEKIANYSFEVVKRVLDDNDMKIKPLTWGKLKTERPDLYKAYTANATQFYKEIIKE